MRDMLSYIALIGAFSLNSLANILLKMQALQPSQNPHALGALIFQYKYFLGAMLAFVCNIFLYYIALRALPLVVAYPVMTVMSFMIVNIFAQLFFAERIGTLGVFGYLLVILGLLLIVLPKHA